MFCKSFSFFASSHIFEWCWILALMNEHTPTSDGRKILLIMYVGCACVCLLPVYGCLCILFKTFIRWTIYLNKMMNTLWKIWTFATLLLLQLLLLLSSLLLFICLLAASYEYDDDAENDDDADDTDNLLNKQKQSQIYFPHLIIC